MSRNSAPAPPACLTIAGFDPSSGAGVTADLKTFAAHKVYGVAAITALTVQSTAGVRGVEPVRPSLVRGTLECLAADMPLAGVKLGMLATAGVTAEVVRFLRVHSELRNYTVLDPVFRSTSGSSLLDPEGVALVRDRLLGLVGWVTPNLAELSMLSGDEVATREHVSVAAARLVEHAAALGNPGLAVVVTGGHLDRPDEYLFFAGEGQWLTGERVETHATHGTGCAFSSALTASLAKGLRGREAVAAAKQYVTGALRAAYPLGKGHGPMHHLFACDAEFSR